MKPAKYYQAEEDLRVLVEEREIRKDPKRFKAAQRLARAKLADMKKVAGKGSRERSGTKI